MRRKASESAAVCASLACVCVVPTKSGPTPQGKARKAAKAGLSTALAAGQAARPCRRSGARAGSWGGALQLQAAGLQFVCARACSLGTRVTQCEARCAGARRRAQEMLGAARDHENLGRTARPQGRKAGRKGRSQMVIRKVALR